MITRWTFVRTVGLKLLNKGANIQLLGGLHSLKVVQCLNVDSELGCIQHISEFDSLYKKTKEQSVSPRELSLASPETNLQSFCAESPRF